MKLFLDTQEAMLHTQRAFATGYVAPNPGSAVKKVTTSELNKACWQFARAANKDRELAFATFFLASHTHWAEGCLVVERFVDGRYISSLFQNQSLILYCSPFRG